MSTDTARSAEAPPSDADLLKQQSARRSSGGSPQAIEATMAGISDEVTAEAIERLAREAREKARRR